MGKKRKFSLIHGKLGAAFNRICSSKTVIWIFFRAIRLSAEYRSPNRLSGFLERQPCSSFKLPYKYISSFWCLGRGIAAREVSVVPVADANTTKSAEAIGSAAALYSPQHLAMIFAGNVSGPE
jgi:hypothetical protein